MNCNSCNRTMTQVRGQSHSQCKTCNEFSFPTSIEKAEDPLAPTGKTTDFQCPNCDEALEVGMLRGMVDVCFCNNCRGFVIDSESLGALITELRGSYQGADDKPMPINPSDLDERLPCPACTDSMDSHPYYGPGNVILDTCMHCKLAWMDHGELARIVRAPGVRPNAASSAASKPLAIPISESGNFSGNTLVDFFLDL